MKEIDAIAGPVELDGSKSEREMGAGTLPADVNRSHEMEAMRLRAELREKQHRQRMGFERLLDKADCMKITDLDAEYDLIGKEESVDRLRGKIHDISPGFRFLGAARENKRALRQELSAQDDARREASAIWREYEGARAERVANFHQMQLDEQLALERRIEELRDPIRQSRERIKPTSDRSPENRPSDRGRDL